MTTPLDQYQVGATITLTKFLCRYCDCQWWVDRNSPTKGDGRYVCPNCSISGTPFTIDTVLFTARSLI